VADRKWAHDRWGLVYLVKREYQLAIEKFKDALAIDPKFAIAIHNWGVALADQGKCRLAIDKYQEAIAAEGGRLPGVYNSWAVALGKLGDSEEAI
jgi:tetratricopeptide (TPR) repeat protein